MKRRLDKLEERSGFRTGAPFAVQFGDLPVKVRGDLLAKEEFVERYPEGDLIRFGFGGETARKLQQKLP